MPKKNKQMYPTVTTLTCTYVARAKNKDMQTLQTRQMTQSHVFVLSSLETSPITAATSPPGRAEHQVVSKLAHSLRPSPLT